MESRSKRNNARRVYHTYNQQAVENMQCIRGNHRQDIIAPSNCREYAKGNKHLFVSSFAIIHVCRILFWIFCLLVFCSRLPSVEANKMSMHRLACRLENPRLRIHEHGYRNGYEHQHELRMGIHRGIRETGHHRTGFRQLRRIHRHHRSSC